MKIYLATLALCLLSNCLAMDDFENESKENIAKKVAILLSKTVNASTTKLRGIVKQNANGHLECQLTYDSAKDKYSGTLINKGFSMAEWYDQHLDAQEAQEYYKRLIESQNK